MGDLGWEDPLEKGKATHSSVLAARSRTRLSNFQFLLPYPVPSNILLTVIHLSVSNINKMLQKNYC